MATASQPHALPPTLAHSGSTYCWPLPLLIQPPPLAIQLQLKGATSHAQDKTRHVASSCLAIGSCSCFAVPVPLPALHNLHTTFNQQPFTHPGPSPPPQQQHPRQPQPQPQLHHPQPCLLLLLHPHSHPRCPAWPSGPQIGS